MASDRGAVLQFEADKKRLSASGDTFHGAYNEKPWDRIYNMAKTAACDTVRNGGTFVLVVSADKITMVQRPDAEELTLADPSTGA